MTIIERTHAVTTDDSNASCFVFYLSRSSQENDPSVSFAEFLRGIADFVDVEDIVVYDIAISQYEDTWHACVYGSQPTKRTT